ncbi:MAG: tetratricopeptide repeat protein [Candidatus Margulisbacteria bacterium]|jgi:tetratricopeptide (TPR) repeat protein|nr:tetratricopeptide repeat protein [Candidatus Margulisiibacteriota bacterium]
MGEIDNSIDLTSFKTEQQMQGDAQSVNSFFQLAQESFNEKRYRVAIIYLRKILQIDNTYASAFKMLARIFQIRRNYKKAAEILRQGVEINFRDADLHYQLGYTYYLQGDRRLFARECTKALVVNPNYARAYYALALLNFESQKYDKAYTELEKCLKLNAHDIEAHYLLARIHIRRRDFTAAQAELEQTISLNVNYLPGHYYLAGLLYRADSLEQALEHYLKCGERNLPKVKKRVEQCFAGILEQNAERLRQDPHDIDALMDIATLYFRKGDYAAAKQTLEKIIQIAPNFVQAQINYGLLLVYENKYLEAVKQYQAVLQKSPANREARVNLDKAYVLAEKYYFQYFEQESARRNLLELYMLAQAYDKAVLVMLELQTDIYARDILNKLTKGIAAYKVYEAAVLFLLGEHTQAEYMFKHLEENTKDAHIIYYFLGLLAKKQNHLTDAYRYFERSKNLREDYWFVDKELLEIRNEAILRIEQKLEAEEVSAEICYEYLDLLLLTRAYKKALQQIIAWEGSELDPKQLLERKKKALDLYERVLELELEGETPPEEVYLDLGEIYVFKKRYNEAFLLFQNAMSQYPQSASIAKYYNYLIKKNIEVYESLRDTNSTMVFYNLAVMYALAGRKAEMFKMLEAAVNRDKKLAIQARYEEAFARYHELDRFRLITIIEGEDTNIYRMQD